MHAASLYKTLIGLANISETREKHKNCLVFKLLVNSFINSNPKFGPTTSYSD